MLSIESARNRSPPRGKKPRGGSEAGVKQERGWRVCGGSARDGAEGVQRWCGSTIDAGGESATRSCNEDEFLGGSIRRLPRRSWPYNNCRSLPCPPPAFSLAFLPPFPGAFCLLFLYFSKSTVRIPLYIPLRNVKYPQK